MNVLSPRWLLLALAPTLGCASISTSAFDETPDAATTSHDAIAGSDAIAVDASADDSMRPPDDSGVVVDDTGVVVDDTGVVAKDTGVDTGSSGAAVQCASSAGGQTCSGGDHCCIGQPNPFSGGTYTCQSPTTPCNGVDLACSQTSDCRTGEVCCASYSGAGGGGSATVDSSACAAPSGCTAQTSHVILCDPSAPNVCPQGRSCQLSTYSLPGYYFCR